LLQCGYCNLVFKTCKRRKTQFSKKLQKFTAS
jgi:hypothetical protein